MTQELITFIKFIAVAIVRTLFDIILWRFFVYVLKDDSKGAKFFQKLKLNKYAAAQAISFIISMVISYFSNLILVFGESKNGILVEMFQFALVSVVAFFASVWFIEWATTAKYILDQVKKIKILEDHWPLMTKLLSIGITVVINYLGYRFLVFA
jgi:putative flippase GtrA